jgi:AcrR family transcriptional regulator
MMLEEVEFVRSSPILRSNLLYKLWEINMDNKEIQRQRMIRYFIDAAKEIIKEEGVKGVSARKVGDRAGYSYATIYNYFKDINTLLTYCIFEFLEDCYKYMMEFKNNEIDPREQIVDYAAAYFKYFTQNPDKFKLIFLEELGEAPEELMKNTMVPSVGILLRENLVKCADKDYIKKEDVKILQDLIGFSVHGKLLFLLQGRSTESLEDILDSIKNEIKFLLRN